MRLLRRYISRAVIGPFFFAFGALTGLLMMNQLAKKFGDLVGKDLPPRVIAEVLVLSLPFIIALTLPMAVLVAILYGYSQLGNDNEITAMRASGVSVVQMLRPALVAGVVLAVLNFLFVDQVLPRTNARLRSLLNDVAQKKPAFHMREQAINELRPYFIRAGRVFPGSGRLRDVEIYDMSLADAARVIYADSGRMAFDQKGTDLILKLFTGKVHEYKTNEPGKIQVTDFVTNTVRVREVQNKFNLSTDNFQFDDREMTTCEMMDRVTAFRRQASRSEASQVGLARQDLRALMRLVSGVSTPTAGDTASGHHCGEWRKIERAIGKALLPEVATAQDRTPPPATTPRQAIAPPGITPRVPVVMPSRDTIIGPAPFTVALMSSFADAVAVRDEHRNAVIQANRFTVEIHKKYTISVACFTFVLIGVALALRFPRGGMGLVIGGGLLIFAIFYVSLTGGEALGDRGIVVPWVAMWFPNALMLLAGIVGLIRVNREFGSTRGGDLADLFDTIRGWLRLRRREA
jgi:lipopolysaccharide export system permease protein